VNNKEQSSFAAPVMLGFSHDYANLSQWLDENLVPANADDFRKREKECIISEFMFASKDMGKYFKRGIESLSDPIPASVVQSAGVMGQHGTPKAPWYLYEVSRVELTTA
jgi:hypothetical protein